MKWRHIQVNFKTAMTTHAAADQPLFDRSKPPAEKGGAEDPAGPAGRRRRSPIGRAATRGWRACREIHQTGKGVYEKAS